MYHYSLKLMTCTNFGIGESHSFIIFFFPRETKMKKKGRILGRDDDVRL